MLMRIVRLVLILVVVSIICNICIAEVRLYDIVPQAFKNIEQPTAINDYGHICGPPRLDTGAAFIWQDNVSREIPFEGRPYGLPSGTFAEDINNNGWVIGSGSGFDLPQLFNGSEVVTLPSLGGRYVWGNAINDKNQVAGSSRTGNGNESHACMWIDGNIIDLGTLGGNYGSARDINNNGVVIGTSEVSDDIRREFVWQNGIMTQLETLGGVDCKAFKINDSNDIVGWSETENGDIHACIWENGVIRDLGTAGGKQSMAHSINDHGQILGWTEDSEGYRCLVIWEGEDVHKLEDLINPDSKWQLMVHYWQENSRRRFLINNQGVILGEGFINGGFERFIMTPREEPFDILQADIDGDGGVGLSDFAILSEEWLK